MKLEKVVRSCNFTLANSVKALYDYLKAYLFYRDGILLCGVTNISVDYPIKRVHNHPITCYFWCKETRKFQLLDDDSQMKAVNVSYTG